MEQESPEENRGPNLKVWLYRGPLLLLLLLAFGALFVDQRSRSQQQAAFQTVYAMLPNEESGEQIQEEDHSPAAVHQVLAREPDATPVNTPQELQEVYRWSGAFYTYTVRVVYRRDYLGQKTLILAEVHSQ